MCGAAAACRDGNGGAGSEPAAKVPGRAADPPSVAYRPPPDGLLKREQIETYLKVLETAARSAGAASRAPGRAESSSGSSALVDEDPVVAPDVVAARALHLNEEEFLWVRERVLEAEAAATAAKLNGDVLTMLERTISDLRARRAGASEQASRQLIDEQISSFEAERERVRLESNEPEPEQIRGNLKALEPHRSRIATLEAAIDRSASATRTQRKGVSPPPR